MTIKTSKRIVDTAKPFKNELLKGDFENNNFDIELDYEGDMDGKLLVSLIVGKYMAGRVNGIQVIDTFT